MSILEKHIDFVKEQVTVQERLARRYADQIGRSDLHKKSADKFRELLDDLIAADKVLEAEANRRDQSKNISRQLSLTPRDLDGLPQDLIDELSVSDADKLEFSILEVIEDAGGILSLDKILIGLWRLTKEVHKRNTITSRLYRMAQKSLIFPVPSRKGVYATRELSDEEVSELLGLGSESSE